jgi:hypothetical protein
MEKKGSQKESRVERADSFWRSLADWRRERIRKTLMRPLYQEALRSLFLVGVLLIDSLFPLQLLISLPYPYNFVGCLALFGVLIYVEVKIYNKIWGKNGRWSLQKYGTTSDQITKEKEHSKK